VLDALARAPSIGEVVVVEGAYELELGPASRARLAPCADWALGPGASLRCGLAALDDEAEAAVVVLADGPWLASEAVERVLAAWNADGGELVAASYGGARGHPLVLARRAWTDIPDEGLRGRAPRLVPCDDLGDPGDVDVPADLPAD